MWRSALCTAILPALLPAAGTGELLFRTHCAPCHGPNGEGGRGSTLAVRNLARAPDDAALAGIITLGIPGTQMPPTRMTAEERNLLVEYVRKLGAAAAETAAGNAAHGEQIFWEKGCGQCHTVGPRGGTMGPDLTEIGAKRGAAHLRTSVLAPEAEVPDTFAVYRRIISVPDNFLQVRATTRDGRQITGVRLNEDTFTIQIRDYSDRVYSFRKDELLELKKDWGKSPMPSYRGKLSAEELTDLLAYLTTLRGQR